MLQPSEKVKARYCGFLPDIYKAFANDPAYLESINDHMAFPILAGPSGKTHRTFGLDRVWLGLVQQSGIALIDKKRIVRHIQVRGEPGTILRRTRFLGCPAKSVADQSVVSRTTRWNGSHKDGVTDR